MKKHVIRGSMLGGLSYKNHLDVWHFGLSVGIISAICVFLLSVGFILGAFPILENLILDIYGPFGYSISWAGAVLGALYGFIDGVIFGSLIAWIYNKFNK